MGLFQGFFVCLGQVYFDVEVLVDYVEGYVDFGVVGIVFGYYVGQFGVQFFQFVDVGFVCFVVQVDVFVDVVVEFECVFGFFEGGGVLFLQLVGCFFGVFCQVQFCQCVFDVGVVYVVGLLD